MYDGRAPSLFIVYIQSTNDPDFTDYMMIHILLYFNMPVKVTNNQQISYIL